jgi:hypothetical protein
LLHVAPVQDRARFDGEKLDIVAVADVLALGGEAGNTNQPTRTSWSRISK